MLSNIQRRRQRHGNYYEGYISEMKANEYGLFPGNLSGASQSLHYCDYCTNIKSGTGFAFFGGNCNSGVKDGAFYVHLSDTVSYSRWGIGARLSLKTSA